MYHTHAHSRQDGAVIITVALMLFFLLGFMGIALDFGRLFIVKSELQTAMDSCALAAAQELDGLADAKTRASSAGRTAGNLNRVDMQSATWGGKGMIVDANITYRDSTYTPTTSALAARYAECTHTQPDVRLWLLQMLGVFSGNTTTFPTTQNVGAFAVATRGSAQTTCPIPVALKAKAGGNAGNNFNFLIGEWVTVFGNRTPGSGELGWYNLDGSNSANETKKELSEGGSCGTRIGDVLGTPGAQTAVDTPWNYRFGIYKNNELPSINHPDFTGYAYTGVNWRNLPPQNAFAGQPATGSDPTAENYLIKRGKYSSFDDAGTNLKDGSRIAFNDQNALNSFKTLATPGTGGEHMTYGYSRRLVVVPVIDASSRVTDYACMFMLEPLTGPQANAHLEYRGLAGSPSSPCTTNGIPGGTAGPLVPVLVR
ncbi:MAG: hypothetical protein JWR22_2760 [Herminiimonas sp.]|nr:hypothetical protein [Herminiimonas sp.]